MLIHDIVRFFEEESPTYYAEDFDNVGLLVGDKNTEVNGILVCHDSLESVIDEAIREECNLIVSFHPIIFSGLKSITGRTYVERVVMKALKHDIAIFSNHTALDNSWNGVNDKICQKLGLANKKVLIPQKDTIKKLITFVPLKNADHVRNAIFKAGAGAIGNYDNCSFNIEGQGSFRGNEESSPVLGQKGELHFEREVQIGATFPKHLEKQVLQALFKAHPYEEVAYEVTTLDNTNQHIGMGMIGELKTPMAATDFLNFLKKTMRADGIRYSKLIKDQIKNVAVLGGSGSFAIEAAMKAGADIFVSADFKYHDFFRAENTIILADIGHYESEQYTKELLHSYLMKKMTNFATSLAEQNILISDINTNPISYL